MSDGQVDNSWGNDDDEIVRMWQTPEFHRNPYSVYSSLRAEAPVFCSSAGIWYLSGHSSVVSALKDPRLSSERQLILNEWSRRQPGLRAMSRLVGRLGRSMAGCDPPDHTRLRRLVFRAFTPRSVESMRSRIEKIVEGLLDGALRSDRWMDVVAELARPLPVIVICEFFGIPAQDRARIGRWAQTFADNVRPGLSSAEFEHAAEALGAFEEYLRWLIAVRSAAPRDDLLSRLVAAGSEGDRLSSAEVLSSCFLLLIAGHETTVNLIGNGTNVLLRHPGELQRLRRDPLLIRPAVEEVVRYDAPLQKLERIAIDDVPVEGRTIPSGSPVFLLIGAANRDPARFDDPDRLDVSRANDGHVGFGHGRHFCLGAHLARLEAEVALSALFRRMPNARLIGEPLRRPNPSLRGLRELRVEDHASP